MTTADKRDQLLQIAIKTDVAVDRWDNIKYSLESGKEIRLNFKKNVIRVEVKYATDSLGWTRLNSMKISKINLRKWQSQMEIIYNHQNGVEA